jgi:hypothetical protein
VQVAAVEALLSPWLGISTDAWAGIIGGAIVTVAAAGVSTLLYRLGRLRPLKVTASARTRKTDEGGSLTLVTIELQSRTKDTQTVRRVALAQWPSWRRRWRHPRWRTSQEGIAIEQFDSIDPPDGKLALEGKDNEEISGWTAHYPPYGDATRVLVQGIRKRPILKRIKTRV